MRDPGRVPKNIVVLCDGTWNRADQRCPTNVEKLRVAAVDGPEQIVRYVPGVGTDPGVLDRFLGGAFGLGLSARVMEAYRFVVENYTDGDRIYLLGFSRGAYTARSTAGMIRNVGVLRPAFRDERTYRRAMAIYRDRRSADLRPDGDTAVAFRAEHSVSPRIRFVGVWDTVGALGIPLGGLRLLNVVNRRAQFHDTQLSSTIEAAFHALAIDERRRAFRPTLWQLSTTARTGRASQQVEQVWFSGVHSNVGGGYPDTGLSDIALNWLAGRAAEHGLLFRTRPPGTGGPRERALEKWIGSDPRLDAPLTDSRRGIFRLGRRYVRRLGEDGSSATEAAFFTAQRRWTDDAAYRGTAANLASYLDGGIGRILPTEDPDRAPAQPALT